MALRESAEPSLGFARRDIVRVKTGATSAERDLVADEVPVAMRYNDRPFAVMMATPADLVDFAIGFSLSEGLITDLTQLLDIKVLRLLEGITLSVMVSQDAPATRLDPEAERLMPGRSGCGICGTRELEDLLRPPPRLLHQPSFQASAFQHALETLSDHQPLNQATGSMHAAAWANSQGQIQLVREDVGRHNALDKLIGALHRNRLHAPAGMVLISSRASYEMVTKAATAGVALLAAVSAPTALAIDLARSAGMCLIGFARPHGYNIYTYPERLV